MKTKRAKIPTGYSHPLRGPAKPPGTLIKEPGDVVVVGFGKLDERKRQAVQAVLAQVGVRLPDGGTGIEDLKVRRLYPNAGGEPPRDLTSTLARALASTTNRKVVVGPASQAAPWRANPARPRGLGEMLDFAEVKSRARRLADRLLARTDAIADLLADYECHNVVLDEIERSYDLLVNLHRNQDYFRHRVGLVKAHLPSNQPLYAQTCFGIVPALMAEEVLVRPPDTIQPVADKLAGLLELGMDMPNLHLRSVGRAEFTEERREDTEAVIFAGTPENAARVRAEYGPNVLFILNGAGHNPLVVTQTGDVSVAVTSTLRVCLQNQGQDCAAPNSILVHNDRVTEFQEQLLDRLKAVEPLVGPCRDRNNIVGPNSRRADLPRIQQLFQDNASWHVYGGGTNVISGLIWPTVFRRPLSQGPWLREFFAPVFMLQPYDDDKALSAYFQHPDYAPNAMYVSVFGHSPYVEGLVAQGMHTPDNLLRDTDLHQVERGWKPYGGTGYAASSLSIHHRVLPGATLPQRDLYLHLVASLKT